MREEKQAISMIYDLVESICEQAQFKTKEGVLMPLNHFLMRLAQKLYELLAYANLEDQRLILNEANGLVDAFDNRQLTDHSLYRKQETELLLFRKTYEALEALKAKAKDEPLSSYQILEVIDRTILYDQSQKLTVVPLDNAQISLAKIVIHSLITTKNGIKAQQYTQEKEYPPIPRYTILKKLGEGAFSTVYQASLDQGQSYALKLGVLENEARFLREIKNMKLVDHPNVIPLIDAGISHWKGQGYYWISMPEMRTINLKHLIDQKQISLTNQWLILSQILSGLCALHEKGIVHRDLKPANCLISEDFQIKLSDFGLSKNISPLYQDLSIEESRHQQAIGTPAYMSPEQAQGKNCDFSSDIWAFGIIAYELFFGEIPFGKSDNMFVLVANLLKESIDFSRPIQQISPQALSLIQKCLQKDKQNRFPNAISLKPIFQALISQELIQIQRHEKFQYCSTLLSMHTLSKLAKVLMLQSPSVFPSLSITECQQFFRQEAQSHQSLHPFLEELLPEWQQHLKRMYSAIQSLQSNQKKAALTVDELSSLLHRALREAINEVISDFDQAFKTWEKNQILPYFLTPVPKNQEDQQRFFQSILILIAFSLCVIAYFIYRDVYDQPSFAEQYVQRQKAKQFAQALPWISFTEGRFLMGSLDGPSDERPIREVKIKPFQITKTEITVAQYQACVIAKACTEPDSRAIDSSCNWGWPDRLLHPINCVDWYQAREFAQWVGGDLPSEAQWEYAAKSGGKDKKYPWGDLKPSCERAVMFEEEDGCGKKSTWPVCQKPLGHTEQGLCDMAGNTWEWVLDEWHSSYEDAPIDQRAWCSDQACVVNQRSSRVRKGGGWYNYGSAADLRISDRSGYAPSFRYYYLGFRVVRAMTQD